MNSSKTVSVNPLQAYVDRELDMYEMRADNGDYTPNDQERALMEDFVNGLIGDEKFLRLCAEIYDAVERPVPETPAEHVHFRAAGWLAAPDGESRESTVSLIQNLVARIGECEKALRWMCPNHAYFTKHSAVRPSRDETPAEPVAQRLWIDGSDDSNPGWWEYDEVDAAQPLQPGYQPLYASPLKTSPEPGA